MSRAELRAASAPHRLFPEIRESAIDFAYHAWPFLGGNVVLGAVGLAIVYLSFRQPAVLLLLPILAVPAAGTMRMATRLVRDGRTGIVHFGEVLRRPWLALGLGTLQLALTAVLAADLLIALAWGGWLGTLLAVSAAYGLLALWVLALLAWPLLLDPMRDAEPIGRRMRLALLVVAVHPVRIGLYAFVMGVLLLASTVLIAPLVTAAVALLWILDARYVLSVADRLERRPDVSLDEGPGLD